MPPKAACLDFAVTHPQQSNIIKCASVCTGAAAAQYEEAVKDMKLCMSLDYTPHKKNVVVS